MLVEQTSEDSVQLGPVSGDLREHRGPAGGVQIERAVEQRADALPEMVVQWKHRPYPSTEILAASPIGFVRMDVAASGRVFPGCFRREAGCCQGCGHGINVASPWAEHFGEMR